MLSDMLFWVIFVKWYKSSFLMLRRKSCSACQCIVCNFDPVNSVTCDILRFCDILYEVLFIFWVVVHSRIRSCTNKYNNNLTHMKGGALYSESLNLGSL